MKKPQSLLILIESLQIKILQSYCFSVEIHNSSKEPFAPCPVTTSLKKKGNSIKKKAKKKIEGQVGPGSEQPDLVKDVPADCRGIGRDHF